ncbi:zinc-binding protein A33-like [Scyliorhinus torazame]|uniref:zinc-binding protein A33-like n=1 Tax=Scyliorhinus torazame TaxID=75743 RepID=UPI003B5A74D3
MASPDLTQELTCPICLEIFTQPVSLECGHHFWSSCISQSWQEVPGDVSCPQCRQVFIQRNVRPALTLNNIVERFRGQKVKVTQPQEEFYCQEHEEKLKLFCEDEHKTICLVCGMSRAHKTHSVIPIKEAAQIYKNKLETSLETLQKQMDLSLHSKREREDGILHMKAEVDRLRNEINSEFEKMHKFLVEKEVLLKAEVERKSNKVFEEMESNLTKTMDELSSLEGAIRDLKSWLAVQEAPEFLKDIQDLLMRSQMVFHKPGTVSTQLPVDIAGEPVKYIKVWREMRAAISPESVNRKGEITRSPENGFGVIARSPNCKSLKIPDVISQLKVKPRKLGIYLDYEGGQVSFYDAEDMSHLYTFTDTFTEKLYPIFNPCNDKSGDNLDSLTLLTG